VSHPRSRPGIRIQKRRDGGSRGEAGKPGPGIAAPGELTGGPGGRSGRIPFTDRFRREGCEVIFIIDSVAVVIDVIGVIDAIPVGVVFVLIIVKATVSVDVILLVGIVVESIPVDVVLVLIIVKATVAIDVVLLVGIIVESIPVDVILPWGIIGEAVPVHVLFRIGIVAATVGVDVEFAPAAIGKAIADVASLQPSFPAPSAVDIAVLTVRNPVIVHIRIGGVGPSVLIQVFARYPERYRQEEQGCEEKPKAGDSG
jgi:hypothetical protein